MSGNNPASKIGEMAKAAVGSGNSQAEGERRRVRPFLSPSPFPLALQAFL